MMRLFVIGLEKRPTAALLEMRERVGA